MNSDLLSCMEDLPEPVAATAAAFQQKMVEQLRAMGRLPGAGGWLAEDRRLPGALRLHFERFLRLYDDWIRFMLAYLRRSGHAVRCVMGCSACCRQMPAGMSRMEIVHLYHGMWQRGDFPRFIRRCLECDERLNEVYRNRHGQGADDAGGVPLGEILQQYHRLEQECPFLENSLCRLYRYRPLVCRMHFSLSPPHWCRPSHFQSDYAVRFNLEPGTEVQEALTELDHCFAFRCSELMTCALLELAVNRMKFEKIDWT